MLFLPLEEQGQQSTTIPINYHLKLLKNKPVLDHVNCPTEHLRWMSKALCCTCVECQNQWRLPALSEFGHVEASFLKVSVPGKLPKWQLDQRVCLVIVKRYLTYQVGEKDLWVDSRTDKELELRKTRVAHQTGRCSLRDSINGSLSHEIQEAEIGIV